MAIHIPTFLDQYSVQLLPVDWMIKYSMATLHARLTDIMVKVVSMRCTRPSSNKYTRLQKVYSDIVTNVHREIKTGVNKGSTPFNRSGMESPPLSSVRWLLAPAYSTNVKNEAVARNTNVCLEKEAF